MIVITGSLFQPAGPISGVRGNSMYRSAKALLPERHPDLELPHITIQMPVYKERLKGVSLPTMTSLIDASSSTRTRRNGLVIHQRMQLVKPELAEARKALYELNGIGWCSRPAQCTEEGPKYFIRNGKFKKASNMNYCLEFSLRVQDEMLKLVEDMQGTKLDPG
jgi:hypothetical protein